MLGSLKHRKSHSGWFHAEEYTTVFARPPSAFRSCRIGRWGIRKTMGPVVCQETCAGCRRRPRN